MRSAKGKLAIYFDPDGNAASEYELYDLERDPNEATNLVERASGRPLDRADRTLRLELGEQLDVLMSANGTSSPRVQAL